MSFYYQVIYDLSFLACGKVYKWGASLGNKNGSPILISGDI